MNGTNIFRMVLTGLVLAWAVVELMPPTDTPFREYILERVTAEAAPPVAEGETAPPASDLATQAEQLTAFSALVERAQAEVNANTAEGLAPAERNPAYATLSIALQTIANEEGIDIAQYFADLDLGSLRNLRKRNATVVRYLLQSSKGKIRPGLDLNGGVSITFEVPLTELSDDAFIRDQQMQDVRSVILDRVDGLGVAEPIVRMKGTNFVEVQMPGISSQENPDIAGTIGAPAKLEFSTVHRFANPRVTPDAPLGYRRMVMESEDPETGAILEEPLYIKRIPAMTGEAISDSRPQITQSGGYEVAMDFTSAGGQQFAELTESIALQNNASRGDIGRLAIILDGRLISAPTVRERIGGGAARITGRFDQREAFELSNALNNPLAVELEVSELNDVGATLAADARDASIQAALWGGGLVVLFMIVYYGLFGAVAMFTVALNLLIVIGALSSLGATITLPGVAALVLTIGMAVDASILIFERIREELNAGKSIENAVVAGYEKAFSTIVDANVTTLITALILVWQGTGPVQGFGVTLAAGILATVFCALIVSRWLIDLIVATGLAKKPFKFVIFQNTKFETLNYAKYAFMGSWAIVLIAAISFTFHIDEAFGIDFTGGDEVRIAYEERLAVTDVEAVAASAEYTFTDEENNAVTEAFGEVNVFFQTPLGAEQDIMVVQTELEKGRSFYEALAAAYPSNGLEILGETRIGSAVGDEVTRSAFISMGLALFAMLFYIAVRFEFGFGLGAVVATLHDALMTIGLFVLLGELLGIGSGQFTAPMIAAVLMTVGYSINDTIVVFDRIREELELNPGLTLRKVIHHSINRVLNRTVLTSVTTFFAAFVLFLFGAGVIQDFALVFLLGILTGTFSSVFIATPVFYAYHKGDRTSVEKGEILPSYDWTGDDNKPKPADAASNA